MKKSTRIPLLITASILGLAWGTTVIPQAIVGTQDFTITVEQNIDSDPDQVVFTAVTKTSGHKPLPSRCIGGGARRAVRSVRA
jgi:hypothetical protein